MGTKATIYINLMGNNKMALYLNRPVITAFLRLIIADY